ncbi:DUF2065 domain-containing protein [Afipia sp. TerB]
MRSMAFIDFLVGIGMVFVIEGLLFAAAPEWVRKAMKSALDMPENMLRIVGLATAVVGLILIWFLRHVR